MTSRTERKSALAEHLVAREFFIARLQRTPGPAFPSGDRARNGLPLPAAEEQRVTRERREADQRRRPAPLRARPTRDRRTPPLATSPPRARHRPRQRRPQPHGFRRAPEQGRD